MISTKELRLGNKVQTSKGQVITVQQVLSNSVVYESKMELNQEMVSTHGADTRYYAQLNEIVKEMDCTDIEPIVLSEDILRRCGFRNYLRELWIFKIGNSNYEWEFVDGSLRLRNPAPCLAPIQTLHQLQNFLYWGLGYELEFSGFTSIIL